MEIPTTNHGEENVGVQDEVKESKIKKKKGIKDYLGFGVNIWGNVSCRDQGNNRFERRKIKICFDHVNLEMPIEHPGREI